MSRSYTLSDAARARRDAQKQSTRHALLDAARSLVAERGIEGISVLEVGRRAGVSHSLINAYFDGKAGLITALVKDFYAALVERTEAIAAGPGRADDRLRAVLIDWAAFDLENPKLLKVLQSHGWLWSDAAEAENREDRRAFLAPVAGLLVAGQASGIFRQGVVLTDALAAIWAIYMMGMRDAVFCSPVPSADMAIDAIWGQIMAVIAVAPTD